MTKVNRGVVRLEFVDWTAIPVYDSVSIRESYTDPLGSYSFEFSPPSDMFANYDAHLQKGRGVRVFINDALQVVGIITSRRTTISKRDGIRIGIECKSGLVTAYEGSVDPNISNVFKSDTSVLSAVMEVMDNYGWLGIVGDEAAHVSVKMGGTIQGLTDKPITVDGLKHQDIKANYGETAYSYCARLFTKLGCVLHCDTEKNLLLSRPLYNQAASYSLIADSNVELPGDRMLDPVEVTETNDGQYSEVVVVGEALDKKGQTRSNIPGVRMVVDNMAQYVPAKAPFQKLPYTPLTSGRHSYWSQAVTAVYKPIFHKDRSARDNERTKNVALIVMGSRGANSFQVRCSVDGLISETGKVWTINTMAHVRIGALGIDENMWIMERQIDVDRRGGQRTTLTLIPKGALVLGEIPNQ